jgi:hypothetical protein
MEPMLRVFTILLISTLAAAQAGSAPPAQTTSPTPAGPANPTDSENSAKARSLLDQATAALGGPAYLTAQNRVEEGRWYTLYHGQSHGTGAQYRRFSRFPEQDRLEIIGRGNVFIPLPMYGSVDVIVMSKKSKNDIVIIHNGDKGYETTNKGTSSEDKEELTGYLRRRQHSLELVLRTWIKDPAMQYFYDGMAIVDGKPTDQVTLLNKQNDAVTIYLDQNSHLPLKTSFTWRDPKDKQKNVEEEIFDNYRLEQGVVTPHSITRTFNGEMTHQRFINTAKYNLPLHDSIFQATVDYDPVAPPKKR